MTTERILVIGANGQIGSELTEALAKVHGHQNILATDITAVSPIEGLPYLPLNVLDALALAKVVTEHRITQIYHLAAVLSAAGERDPQRAWHLNMSGLLNVLETARQFGVHKVFWPSSIAVFGPSTPREHAPQQSVMDPQTVYGISKLAGESWCEYYHRHHGIDVRSLRYPGLISYKTPPGGGTTDYAIEIFHAAKARWSSWPSGTQRVPPRRPLRWRGATPIFVCTWPSRQTCPMRTESTSRMRKKRPVTSTSNSFSIVSDCAVNGGPVAVQVARSMEDSST